MNTRAIKRTQQAARWAIGVRDLAPPLGVVNLAPPRFGDSFGSNGHCGNPRPAQQNVRRIQCAASLRQRDTVFTSHGLQTGSLSCLKMDGETLTLPAAASATESRTHPCHSGVGTEGCVT